MLCVSPISTFRCVRVRLSQRPSDRSEASFHRFISPRRSRFVRSPAPVRFHCVVDALDDGIPRCNTAAPDVRASRTGFVVAVVERQKTGIAGWQEGLTSNRGEPYARSLRQWEAVIARVVVGIGHGDTERDAGEQFPDIRLGLRWVRMSSASWG